MVMQTPILGQYYYSAKFPGCVHVIPETQRGFIKLRFHHSSVETHGFTACVSCLGL